MHNAEITKLRTPVVVKYNKKQISKLLLHKTSIYKYF